MKQYLYRFFITIALLQSFTIASNGKTPEMSVNTDRQLWCDVMYRMASPVLSNMSKGLLKKNMLIEVSPTWDGRSKEVIYLECFGRLMAGLAPWLTLPDDDTVEGIQRQKLRNLALLSYKNAVDPLSSDYLFGHKEKQTLVDAAFIANSFLRAYDVLWLSLDTLSKQRYIDHFIELRKIDPPFSNWLLFSAMIETFLHKIGADHDSYRISSSLRQIEEWYVGDGWYSDGPEFALDYYNCFVIHPMYIECLNTISCEEEIVQKWDMPNCAYSKVTNRLKRLGITLERMISPEGTFPVIGRSITYRTAILQPLALLAWKGWLPDELCNGQVRAAMSAVIQKMFLTNQNFNMDGYLTLGFNGKQPHVSDYYINNGSLYMASLAFLPLGLSPNHPFWTDPSLLWTAKKAWCGNDFPSDHSYKE